MEQLLVTRYEAAEALSISVDTLDELCRCGKVKKIYLGSRACFRPEDLKAFVKKEAERC